MDIGHDVEVQKSLVHLPFFQLSKVQFGQELVLVTVVIVYLAGEGQVVLVRFKFEILEGSKSRDASLAALGVEIPHVQVPEERKDGPFLLAYL